MEHVNADDAKGKMCVHKPVGGLYWALQFSLSWLINALDSTVAAAIIDIYHTRWIVFRGVVEGGVDFHGFCYLRFALTNPYRFPRLAAESHQRSRR
jgi:hypothetical protein